jgi:hypothetical protein
MVIFVFLLFLVMFGLAGTFISIEAMKRTDGSGERDLQAPDDRAMGQGASDLD